MTPAALSNVAASASWHLNLRPTLLLLPMLKTSECTNPSLGSGLSLLSGNRGTSTTSKSLISVVRSSFNSTEEDTLSSVDTAEEVGASRTSTLNSTTRKPKGAFPHATVGTPITETLSIRDGRDYEQQEATGKSTPLEILKSLSGEINFETKTSSNRIEVKGSVNTMTTGLFCAVRSESRDTLDWLGSAFTSLDEALSSANNGAGDTNPNALLRPDIMALHEVDNCEGMSDKEMNLSCLLAVSSTLANQIIVYLIKNTAASESARPHEYIK
eukprot:CAMPEP_0114485430 /NCGR_PEP_ID=MMETSP0104-20121206/19943_1 /TAXON_ID=37642 ORGANISM="Paraphysomonas imperforata, Strain PA2" /NCGR_SAMPLE_ID=MMETSP0104 /ASSEMBLY_ACC=CAM_ASM_000202 /LENGTH=270 /DNA_ID=CAMNT_0001661545 /DNA_START=1122 /DNA_END=1934 /DNA_ORIENTATION=+